MVAIRAKIAQLCDVEFEFGKYHLPLFRLPEGWTDGDAYFERLCLDGFTWRYPEQPPEYCMDTRSGLRKRSKYSPYSMGSTLVMFRQ